MRIEGIKGAVLEVDEGFEESVRERGTVLIFPGGGYSWLSDRESWPILHAFQSYGYRGAIVRYDTDSPVLGRTPLIQAAWAMGKARELYPMEPVYVCGFSAGAHVAASIGVHWDGLDWNGVPCFGELRDFLGTDCGGEASFFRPDRMILAYPVITGGEYAHRGSFDRLLGPEADWASNYADHGEYERAMRWASLETQVTKDTPPTFLWQTQEDESVPVLNSLIFMQSLVAAGVPSELHIYPKGVHGLSLATGEVEQPGKGRMADAHVADWFRLMIEWLRYGEGAPRGKRI